MRNKLFSLPKRKAEFIEPMNCAPVTKLTDGPQWRYEVKLDGYRVIAVKADGHVNLFSRRRKSFDHHYSLIVEALAGLPEGTVVDGEIVALDDSGRPDFNLLQNFPSEASHIHYFVLTSWLGRRSYAARLERLGIGRIREIARENGKKGGRPPKKGKKS